MKLNYNNFKRRTIARTHTFSAAGVTFEGRQKLIKKIIKTCLETGKFKPTKLVPEPSNKFDANAIMIFIGNRMVGYVPSNINKELQALIDLDAIGNFRATPNISQAGRATVVVKFDEYSDVDTKLGALKDSINDLIKKQRTGGYIPKAGKNYLLGHPVKYPYSSELEKNKIANIDNFFKDYFKSSLIKFNHNPGPGTLNVNSSLEIEY